MKYLEAHQNIVLRNYFIIYIKKSIAYSVISGNNVKVYDEQVSFLALRMFLILEQIKSNTLYSGG